MLKLTHPIRRAPTGKPTPAEHMGDHTLRALWHGAVIFVCGLVTGLGVAAVSLWGRG